MGKSAIVIGAGILGLATARALAVRGYKVKVFERNSQAIGASIRNFGMIWPVGQPDNGLYERAIFSREVWKETCKEAGIWFDKVGSIHLAYEQDEWNVLNELKETYQHRNYLLLKPDQALAASGAIVKEGLKGGMFSPDEMIVDPRQAIAKIPALLKEKWGVEFFWDTAITDVSYPSVYAGTQQYEADEIFICSGADFETLYPNVFSTIPITKCKLQMMRMVEQPNSWRIGPALCGGLSLIHYNSFKSATSLPTLRARYEQQYPEYIKWGIHVMVSQNEGGQLTVGDSHEYGKTLDPFDRAFINKLILDYLKTFARFRDEQIAESWNGIYPKMTNGQTDLVIKPESGVTILNGMGGAGMTLSFGFADEVVSAKIPATAIAH